MPTNHRGQDVGGHNHSNVVNFMRRMTYPKGASNADATEYTSYDDTRNSSVSYHTSVTPRQGGKHSVFAYTNVGGTPKNYMPDAEYANKGRADKAAQAAVNRAATKGNFGTPQFEIRQRRAARKAAGG